MEEDPSVPDDQGDRDAPPPLPNWLKAVAIAFFVLLFLIGVLLIAGHGPGDHASTRVLLPW